MRKDRRQTDHRYKLKPGDLLQASCFNSFPQEAFLHAHSQLSDFLFWSRSEGGSLAPVCTKKALRLLHLNENERRKREKTLQHAKGPQVLTAHLQPFMEPDTIPHPHTWAEISNSARNNTVHEIPQ